MGQLTTHVLDTRAGVAAAGVRIDLQRVTATGTANLNTVLTGSDGRCGAPLLTGSGFTTGHYLLKFHIGAYFRSQDIELPNPAFLDVVSVEIGVAHAEQHYHVPLLISPWSYSVYRGG